MAANSRGVNFPEAFVVECKKVKSSNGAALSSTEHGEDESYQVIATSRRV